MSGKPCQLRGSTVRFGAEPPRCMLCFPREKRREFAGLWLSYDPEVAVEIGKTRTK